MTISALQHRSEGISAAGGSASCPPNVQQLGGELSSTPRAVSYARVRAAITIGPIRAFGPVTYAFRNQTPTVTGRAQ